MTLLCDLFVEAMLHGAIDMFVTFESFKSRNHLLKREAYGMQ